MTDFTENSPSKMVVAGTFRWAGIWLMLYSLHLLHGLGEDFSASAQSTVSPPVCPITECQNQGFCMEGFCQSGSVYCCQCPPSYQGQLCENLRQATLQITYRSMTAFPPDLWNELSPMHNSLVADLFLICHKSLELFYEMHPPQADIKCLLLNTLNEPMFADLRVDLAGVNGSQLPLMQPNDTNLQSALQTVCASSASMACNNLSIDINTIMVDTMLVTEFNETMYIWPPPPPPSTTGAPPPSMTGAPPPSMTGAPPPTTGAPPPSMTGAPPPSTTGAPPPSMTGAPPPSTTGAPPPSMTGAPPPTTGAPPPSMTGAPPPTTGAPQPSTTGAAQTSTTGAPPPSTTGVVPISSTGATPISSTGAASTVASTTGASGSATTASGSSNTAPSTIVTNLFSTSRPSTTCYSGYCLNDGSCSTQNCPNGASMCCSCNADYIGDRCEKKREMSVNVDLRSATAFSSSLLDPSTTIYKTTAASFIILCKAAVAEYYAAQNMSVYSGCQVLSFSSGSIISRMSVSIAARTRSPVALSVPSGQDMAKAVQTACSQSASTSCTSLNVDMSYAAVTANPDLCASSTTNMCSQYATCTFYSGVNYTCHCQEGFRDDSPNGIFGVRCTQVCTTNLCNQGACTEQFNNNAMCTCPFSVSGRFCQYLSTGMLVIIIVVVVVFVLTVLVAIIVAVKLHKRNSKIKALKRFTSDLNEQ